ncbi:MAG: hypothetical protein LJF04_17950 [Gemmatimonadetes bacterium]|nr:hypothetical protein [Gemmatimonadota bacterium]
MTLDFAAVLFQAPARDTVLAVAARDGLDLAVDISVVVVAVAVVVVALVGTRVLMGLNRTVKELRGGVRQGLGPVSERARAISDNVEFITQALRSDVERLNASVKALTARLHQASDHMEERIEEFNALMEVVQGEAEEIFIDTASTVRGVREGARRITRPPPPTQEEGLPEAGADVAALPGVGARHTDDADGEEEVLAGGGNEITEDSMASPSSQS